MNEDVVLTNSLVSFGLSRRRLNNLLMQTVCGCDAFHHLPTSPAALDPGRFLPGLCGRADIKAQHSSLAEGQTSAKCLLYISMFISQSLVWIFNNLMAAEEEKQKS